MGACRMNLTSLANEYIAVRTQRLELEKQAKELAHGREAELRQAILLEMSAQGFKSVNLEGVGRVVSKETKHYEIKDIELLARGMFRAMLEAAQAGRPFSDGLLLQKRLSREGLDNLMENSTVDSSLDALGVFQVVRNDLSITKS